jgi:hypothetical protein
MKWLPLLLWALPASAVEDQVSGTVLNARLKPLADVIVKLTCVAGEEPSDANHWRFRCDSTLAVERDGKRLAKLTSGTPGLDFEQVAGNSESLELSLIDPGFIAVTDSQREGDQWSREKEWQELFVVDGKTLRSVYRYQSLDAYDPGPDGKDEERQRTEARLTAGPMEKGLPTLVLTRGEDVTKITWDGTKLVDGPLLSAVEPLIARVLAGQKLKAAELKPIGKDGLAKLRNAPYARHGRPFKNPMLQSYFYNGKLKPNPAFRESQLDAADNANLALILAEIKSR